MGEKKLVWTASFYKPKLEKVASNSMAFSGEYLFYAANVQNAVSIYRHDLNSGENKQIYASESQGMIYLFGTPEGELYAQDTAYDRETETHTLTMLKISDPSGAAFAEKLASFDVPKRQMNGMPPFAVDGAGNLYFSYSDAVAVRDKGGALLFELDTKGAMLMNLLRLPDGRVAVERMKPPPLTLPDYYQIIPVNVQTRDWGEPVSIGLYKGRLAPGDGKYLFFSIDREDNLVGYNSETGMSESLFNCRELDINLSQTEGLKVYGDGTVRIVNVTGSATGIVYEVATVTRKPAVEDRRVTLEFAAYGFNQWAREKIAEFNRTDPDYRIHVTEYMTAGSGPVADISAAALRLVEAMRSDAPPDIVDLMFLPKEYLGHRGLLADLYPLIDSDATLTRDSFLAAPLKALETEGRLHYITPGFNLNAFAGRWRVVGDAPGMTYEALEALLDAHPGTAVAHDWSDTAALGLLVTQCLHDFVDWKTRRCHFTDGVFQRLLKLAGRHPRQPENKHPGGVLIQGGVSQKNLYHAARDGDILMENVMVHSFWQLQVYRDLFGEEPAYKAYPARTGRGNIMITDTAMYGISSRSRHPAVAWRLIRELLISDMFMAGFPMLKAAFDKKVRDEMTENYVDQIDNVSWEVTPDREGSRGYKLGEDGRLIRFKQGLGRGNVRPPASQAEMMADTVWIYAASQAEVDKTLALIEGISGVTSYSQAIYDIVCEGAKLYFSREITAEEAAFVIQAKVSNYLKVFE